MPKEELKQEIKLKATRITEEMICFMEDLDRELNKAKELLKDLILEVKSYEEINGIDTCEPVQKAEQFLKE